MSGTESFPVGKVDFLDLNPLSFQEFLEATGKSEWRRFIESLTGFSPIPEPLHMELVQSLKHYYVVGGMPEAVDVFAGGGDLTEVRTIQKTILDAYALDFSKHAPRKDAPKISRVWNSIPGQLARENKKFKFSDVGTGARAREYEDAIEWLADAGLILRACNVSKPGIPLSGYSNHRYSKLYLADIGLLGALARVPQNIMVKGDDLFTEFHGALVENYVAQQLRANNAAELYYWTSKGKAEIDFLVENEGRVFPLEVKAGINPKSKSLRTYGDRFPRSILSRTTLLNLRCDGIIYNYPLYAICRFPMATAVADRVGSP
jgi:predicted AAA+ superfamily ATPase